MITKETIYLAYRDWCSAMRKARPLEQQAFLNELRRMSAQEADFPLIVRKTNKFNGWQYVGPVAPATTVTNTHLQQRGIPCAGVFVIAFSTVRHVRDNRPVTDTKPSWKSFADFLEGQSKRPGIDKGRTLCVCPAIYDDGVIRAKSRVVGWNWFAADIDNKEGNQPHSTIEAVTEKMRAQDAPFVIYTTTSHKSDGHCFRLMFPLDRLVEREEFAEVWASFAQWLGCVDVKTKDESRLFIAPRAWPGAEFHRHDAGEPVCVDLIKLTNPVVVPARASKTLTSAFIDTSGLKLPCPSQISLHGDFVTNESLSKACTGAPGTRMFPFMVRTGVRALLKGYAISADDLASIGFQFATSIGRDTSDIDHDAENAHAAAVSRYAELMAERVEKQCPVKEKLKKWKK
ncbi:hypothetical protein [Sphingomonas xinjiangensis]|uniref:Primase C-terminal 1 domain-containing protein n=1 Tax=Sphingomonas xinjiangensis TaxID=643568 RepID=A0A840YFY5_9SPHN|nr:hypothetical protein [Sphingomonas xinjiangensis]MBB5709688.1 hypothetical protein [Sphingomonas xinjiangensis]